MNEEESSSFDENFAIPLSGVHGKYLQEAVDQGLKSDELKTNEFEETTGKLSIDDFECIQNIGSGSYSEVFILIFFNFFNFPFNQNSFFLFF